MTLWQDDESLFNITREELYTALVGDILDELGYEHQFLSPEIKPVSPSMVTIGRAMPVLEKDIQEIDLKNADKSISQPFGLMFEALDNLKPNEVYICSGSLNPYALWGGLMSTRAQHVQAAGAVVNGYSRDTNEILQLGFPTFSVGSYAQDQKPRGKVIDYRTPIEFDGIMIRTGDIIFGDRDGVLVVPKQVEQKVFDGAIKKAREEKLVRKALKNGKSTVEAYEEFGIM